MKKTSLFSVLISYFACGIFLMLTLVCFVTYIVNVYMEHSIWSLTYEHLKFALAVMLTLYYYSEGNCRYKRYDQQEQAKNSHDTNSRDLLKD